MSSKNISDSDKDICDFCGEEKPNEVISCRKCKSKCCLECVVYIEASKYIWYDACPNCGTEVDFS